MHKLLKRKITTALAIPLALAFCARADSAALEVFIRGAKPAATAPFEQGAAIFSDRDYKLATPPAALRGQPFLRAPIDGMRVHCTAPGTLTVLTPLEVPRATSIAPILRAYGFSLDDSIAPFQLFGKNAFEKVAVYRKSLKQGETLKLGKWCVLLSFKEAVSKEAVKVPWTQNQGEKLYNNIVLPEEWPPEDLDTADEAPMPVPYLQFPPSTINIDVGRQLFVDDFLIESTDLLHMYHLPEKYAGNPVLQAQTPLEKREGLVGGTCRPCVWWHPGKKQYWMWYQAGTYFNGTIALATSVDGLNWERAELDVLPGSNQALPPGFQPDSYGIVPEWRCHDATQRFKLFSTNPGSTQPAYSFTSADGIHWENQTSTGPTGDRSSMFYNPFRKKWIYSLRTSFRGRGRARHYRESEDFLAGAKWSAIDIVPWLASDRLDAPEPGYKHKTQLYNFDAVAYESVMLGFFELHRGPENRHCAQMGLPKLNEISFGYSRDGFHFARPDRRAHLPASRKDDWERGFVEGGGNICLVAGDKLLFYYSGCRGNIDGAIRADGSLNGRCMYDPNAIGVAMLRRDGFASLYAGATTGQITTRPLIFSGSHLFVNAQCPQGELRAEIIGEDNKAIEPYTLANCRPLAADKTLAALTWQRADDLAAVAGRPVRLRFTLRRGALYAFWVSRDKSGASGGHVAGGGPGINGFTDDAGNK